MDTSKHYFSISMAMKVFLCVAGALSAGIGIWAACGGYIGVAVVFLLIGVGLFLYALRTFAILYEDRLVITRMIMSTAYLFNKIEKVEVGRMLSARQMQANTVISNFMPLPKRMKGTRHTGPVFLWIYWKSGKVRRVEWDMGDVDALIPKLKMRGLRVEERYPEDEPEDLQYKF